MKKILFIALVALVLLSSCASIRQTLCPSNDPQYFYRAQGTKPFYYKR